MKIFRFEALETPVVCSSLFDQGYTEVKLIKVVKDFVDSRHHLTVFQVRLLFNRESFYLYSMLSEGFIHRLLTSGTFKVWVKQWERRDDLLV